MSEDLLPPLKPQHHSLYWVAAFFALLGGVFAGVSTADFVSHLDRQFHSIHCSFIPGASAQIGESGCRTVMMSPYSSMFRESMWGGLPISLLAMAVFAYLVYRSVDFAFMKSTTKRETKYLVAATFLPVLMSAIYFYISVSKVGAVCKLCIGVYATSLVLFGVALLANARAPAPQLDAQPPTGLYARWFLEGVAYVAVLTFLYVSLAPVSAKTLEGCGSLVQKKDPHGILVPLGGGTTPALAVLDPLCPACREFDRRLAASDLEKRLDMNVLLFPLDSKCNWMVKESLHPGACAVSEAILCDKQKARQILDWAFANQEQLMAEAKASESKFRKTIAKQFPSVSRCIGKPKVRSKVNKSLRFAVRNALPVLTPQLFINGTRVCDEDTDLGLEFTISKMLERK